MTDFREVVPPPTELEKRLKIFNAVVLTAMIIYTLTNFASLPDEIPIHFNARGEADDWGSKFMLWVLPGVGIFLFILMNFIGKLKPKYQNYPVKLTAENAKRQVELARQMMQGLNALIFVMVFYILFRSVAMAKGDEKGLGVSFIIIFLGGIFGLIGYYMYLANKAK